VSARIAICWPAEPITAGPSARKNCRTYGSSRGQASRSSTPRRRASAISSSNCARPETSTPQLAAIPAFGNRKAIARKPMMKRFNSTGAKAATAKNPCALSVPEVSVAIVMKAR
jgi:hypothetical protein